MADHALRTVARQAHASDQHQSARLLRTRVRQGLAAREDVELAAYLGHEPARAAVGEGELPARPSNTEDWLRGLSRWGPYACGHAALAMGYSVLDIHELASERGERTDLPRCSLEAPDDWLQGECSTDRVRELRNRWKVERNRLIEENRGHESVNAAFCGLFAIGVARPGEQAVEDEADDLQCRGNAAGMTFRAAQNALMQSNPARSPLGPILRQALEGILASTPGKPSVPTSGALALES